MPNTVFITATDTDAGKTWVSEHLIQGLLSQGCHAKAIKPIACGYHQGQINPDIQRLLIAQNTQQISDINRYHFQMAASPHIAAQAEQASIEPKQLLNWCRQQEEQVDTCLIEGIGGLMVPLTPDYLLTDWIGDMPETSLILVAPAKLGSINHTLLSLEKLKQIQHHPAWVIINQIQPDIDVHTLADSIQPYLHPSSKILITLHHHPDALQPILAWLVKKLNS
jgi:dethiobiotin synthetase